MRISIARPRNSQLAVVRALCPKHGYQQSCAIDEAMKVLDCQYADQQVPDALANWVVFALHPRPWNSGRGGATVFTIVCVIGWEGCVVNRAVAPSHASARSSHSPRGPPPRTWPQTSSCCNGSGFRTRASGITAGTVLFVHLRLQPEAGLGARPTGLREPYDLASLAQLGRVVWCITVRTGPTPLVIPRGHALEGAARG